MGEAQLDSLIKQLTIHSHIITYGDAADDTLTELIRDEIETMWNEPGAIVVIDGIPCSVVFKITASCLPHITPDEIISDVNPRNNFFRIEEFAHGNISFVDGLGCNSGYFKVENLYKGSTTAAHEYGHTLGLDHPKHLDIRGKGQPGIMFPRGTLVDPEFQYDSAKRAGETGGTLHPMFRRVLKDDIAGLKLNKLEFKKSAAVLGSFSNVYHNRHLDR